MKLIELNTAIEAICACRYGGKKTLDRERALYEAGGHDVDDYTLGLLNAIDAISNAKTGDCFHCKHSYTGKAGGAIRLKCKLHRMTVTDAWCCIDFDRWTNRRDET